MIGGVEVRMLFQQHAAAKTVDDYVSGGDLIKPIPHAHSTPITQPAVLYFPNTTGTKSGPKQMFAYRSRVLL